MSKTTNWEDHVIQAVRGFIGRTVGGMERHELVQLRPWYNRALALLDTPDMDEKVRRNLDADLACLKWAYIVMDRGEPVGTARLNQPAKPAENVPRGTPLVELFAEEENERQPFSEPAPSNSPAKETDNANTKPLESTEVATRVNSVLAPIWDSQWFASQLQVVRQRFESAEDLFDFKDGLDRAHVVAKAAEVAARMGASRRCIDEAQAWLYRGAAHLHQFFANARANGELKKTKGRPRKGALEATLGELGIPKEDCHREVVVGRYIDKFGVDKFEETLMEAIASGSLTEKAFSLGEKNSRSAGINATSSVPDDPFADDFFDLADRIRAQPTYYSSGLYALGQNEHRWAELVQGGGREMMRSFAEKLLQLLA